MELTLYNVYVLFLTLAPSSAIFSPQIKFEFDPPGRPPHTMAATTEVRFNSGAADDKAVEVCVIPQDRKQSAHSAASSSSGSRKSRRLCPKLFDRASGSWWNPKFDSSLIEKEFKESSFPQIRRRFRYALCYILLACVVWMIYIGILAGVTDICSNWWVYLVAIGVLIVVCALLILFTKSNLYKRQMPKTHFLLALILAGLILATFANEPKCAKETMSVVATFAVCVETILIMYTVIPLPFLFTVGLMLLFSILYEVLYFIRYDNDMEGALGERIATKIFLHACVHLMGIHIFFMQQVRSRSTFMKIGQALVAGKQHKDEKELKMTAIHHLMPQSVAVELLKQEENAQHSRGAPKPFRPLYMNRMENVSILFADIAGFTKMSANKKADELVGLLNNLFGRFDRLCGKCNCEKICTLGDCYYCVSGCPEARPDHAACCVDMGLCMVEGIKDFCKDSKEDVNMRVGIHTGTVLCGVMGSRRFKFDVWSSDVNIANKMEASGEPGRVHVSEKTVQFLGDKYILKENRVDRQPMLLGSRK